MRTYGERLLNLPICPTQQTLSKVTPHHSVLYHGINMKIMIDSLPATWQTLFDTDFDSVTSSSMLLKARKLESDLELKLSAFSKLTNRMDSAGRGEAGLAADQVILTSPNPSLSPQVASIFVTYDYIFLSSTFYPA